MQWVRELPGELGIRTGFAFIDLRALSMNFQHHRFPGAAIDSGTWAVAIVADAATPIIVDKANTIWSVVSIAGLRF